ncbi:MAG TPA: alkaline phosphatase family protein [Candidatus Binatia bacterium]|nr:alkaline phosphatase family protein [Candidatus Binatia bacterium]
MTIRTLGALAAGCALTACNAGAGAIAVPAVPSSRVEATASPIKHVVFIVQENRSFNNLFMGYPGAKTAKYGYDTYGNKLPLQSQVLATIWDIDHSSRAFFKACDGHGSLPGTHCKMDGWNGEEAGQGHPANPAYSYVPRDETAPYWEIAKQYVLADRTFASNLDGSFIAHQYIVAAYASRAVDYPLSYWGCEGGATDVISTLTDQRTYGSTIRVCFKNPTIASEADRASLTWRFYAGAVNGDGGLWSSYQSDRKIYDGPDWKADVISPPAQFLTDVANGSLASVTWITPLFADSDHAGLQASGGPAWVASLVNAIGTSKFWKNTAIFIMWDDWGGWFDPVKPVYEDYDGLGFRVPLLIVSPYAKQGYVTHVQYETASVLRYIEDNFGLGQLAPSDTRARDPANDAFDYAQPPRKFHTIAGSRSRAYWIERSRRPPRMPPAIIGDD